MTELNDKQALLYVGLYVDQRTGKQSTRWHNVTGRPWTGTLNVDAPEEKKNVLLFAKFTPPAGVAPGAVMRVAMQQNAAGAFTSILPSTAELVGIWSDEGQRAEWQARHSALKSLAKTLTGRAKDGARSLHLELLSPLRNAYGALSYAERVHLLANVVGYITNDKGA